MNIYTKRRQIIAKDLKPNSLMIVTSGLDVPKMEDEDYPFYVDRNFYYLTGLDQSNIYLVIYKTLNGVQEKLFIPRFDRTQARWVGARYLVEEAREISEVEDIDYIDNFMSYFANAFNKSRGVGCFDLYLDMWHYTNESRPTMNSELVKLVKDKYPSLKLIDLYPILANLRLIKDEYEINCMMRANEITKAGIESMMKFIKPELNEAVMEAMFNLSLAENTCKENAFDTIAASGIRATTLHYRDNNQIMKDNELFLCDLGATYNKYCADVSRTFPVNGKFTDRQKEIYTLVLNAQKLIEANAKPQVALKDLQKLVVDYYTQELPKIGLTKHVSEYYFHGIGHHLGLNVHDIDAGLGQILKPGMVITNEPGLYIEDESIGIRIEDDLLITETGCKNLTKGIIKEIEDIENFMKK